jgi:hypothetical protein
MPKRSAGFTWPRPRLLHSQIAALHDELLADFAGIPGVSASITRSGRGNCAKIPYGCRQSPCMARGIRH